MNCEKKATATEPISFWISQWKNNTLMTSSNEVPGLPASLRPMIHLGTCQTVSPLQGLTLTGYKDM